MKKKTKVIIGTSCEIIGLLLIIPGLIIRAIWKNMNDTWDD